MLTSFLLDSIREESPKREKQKHTRTTVKTRRKIESAALLPIPFSNRVLQLCSFLHDHLSLTMRLKKNTPSSFINYIIDDDFRRIYAPISSQLKTMDFEWKPRKRNTLQYGGYFRSARLDSTTSEVPLESQTAAKIRGKNTVLKRNL